MHHFTATFISNLKLHQAKPWRIVRKSSQKSVTKPVPMMNSKYCWDVFKAEWTNAYFDNILLKKTNFSSKLVVLEKRKQFGSVHCAKKNRLWRDKHSSIFLNIVCVVRARQINVTHVKLVSLYFCWMTELQMDHEYGCTKIFHFHCDNKWKEENRFLLFPRV